MSAGAVWVTILLLLLNAFFVGAEFAAMAARRSTLEPLAANGSRRAQVCLDALEQMGSLLACAQLGHHGLLGAARVPSPRPPCTTPSNRSSTTSVCPRE